MRDSHYPHSGDPIVFFDVETTGLCPRKDRIIEIAAVKYLPGADAHPHMQRLVAIDRPLPGFITKRTGITDDMLEGAGQPMDRVLDEFIEFIADHPVVAYNINVDTGFLNAAIERHGRRPIANDGHCALARARAAWPHLDNHRLTTVAKHLDLGLESAPRALDQTGLALDVYFHALKAGSAFAPAGNCARAVATGAPAPIPVITGPGQFRIEVIGTRRRQDVFERVCGPRSVKGAALDIQVQLRVERGSNAVRVLLDEEVIGNLAPRVAIDFRRAFVAGHLVDISYCECSARIRGGRTLGPPSEGEYVMWLDIPQDDD